MSQKISGSCLCGEVEYQFQGPVLVFQYCHCSRCQKFTGSEHASNIIITPETFKYTKGENLVTRFDYPNTKHYATCFCKNCGSSLPWLTQSKVTVVVPAGTLDQDPGVRPKHNVFYANKACWYESVDELPKYEALPVK